jgi:hypothetical protein
MLGALKVKSSEASSTKWGENAGRAGEAMSAGAIAAAEDWARNTAASTDNYFQAVTAAGVKNRFRNGVIKAGAAKFARKVLELASARFTQGVAAGKEDYKSGVDPYLSTLASLTLPARKPRGDPSNIARVTAENTALHAKRLALLGGGG